MRDLPFFFLFLILFCSTAYGSGLDYFIFSHLEENETFTTEEVVFENETYHAVLLNRDPSFFVRGEEGAFELVTDEGEIRGALLEYYGKRDITYALLDGLDVIPSLLASFEESREPGEGDCRILTGTDRYPCIGRSTCMQACFAVTSFCQPVASGAGWPFIDSIWAFSNSTRKLDEYPAKTTSLFEQFSQHKTLSNLDALIDIVSSINIEATGINQNDLFNAYSFCAPIDYNMTALLKAQMALFEAREKALPILKLDETVATIAGETNARALLKKEEPEEIEEEIEEAVEEPEEENVTTENVTTEENITAETNTGVDGKNESGKNENSPSMALPSIECCAPLFILLSVFGIVLRR